MGKGLLSASIAAWMASGSSTKLGMTVAGGGMVISVVIAVAPSCDHRPHKRADGTGPRVRCALAERDRHLGVDRVLDVGHEAWYLRCDDQHDHDQDDKRDTVGGAVAGADGE